MRAACYLVLLLVLSHQVYPVLQPDSDYHSMSDFGCLSQGTIEDFGSDNEVIDSDIDTSSKEKSLEQIERMIFGDKYDEMKVLDKQEIEKNESYDRGLEASFNKEESYHYSRLNSLFWDYNHRLENFHKQKKNSSFHLIPAFLTELTVSLHVFRQFYDPQKAVYQDSNFGKKTAGLNGSYPRCLSSYEKHMKKFDDEILAQMGSGVLNGGESILSLLKILTVHSYLFKKEPSQHSWHEEWVGRFLVHTVSAYGKLLSYLAGNPSFTVVSGSVFEGEEVTFLQSLQAGFLNEYLDSSESFDVPQASNLVEDSLDTSDFLNKLLKQYADFWFAVESSVPMSSLTFWSHNELDLCIRSAFEGLLDGFYAVRRSAEAELAQKYLTILLKTAPNKFKDDLQQLQKDKGFLSWQTARIKDFLKVLRDDKLLGIECPDVISSVASWQELAESLMAKAFIAQKDSRVKKTAPSAF